MAEWDRLADRGTVERTMAALRDNGIDAFLVQTGDDARRRLFELIPEGAEVMNHTSTTLSDIGAEKELLESGRYNATRRKMEALDRRKQAMDIIRLRAVQEVGIGSVHAVTEIGQVLVASASGSQAAAYVYGARRLIWVVGTQKIVGTFEDGMRRLHEWCLPHEDSRMRKAYGTGSEIRKVLIINKEPVPGRTTLIFVNEVLGV